MPTFARTPRFEADYRSLSLDDRNRFKVAYQKLVEDLKAGRPPRRGLRVKPVQRTNGVFEITFAPDGRATFEYGTPVKQGDRHVIWRRIGTHDVLDNS
jgi:hypothetical protein